MGFGVWGLGLSRPVKPGLRPWLGEPTPLGFRVYGLGFSLEFRVCRVQGLRSRVCRIYGGDGACRVP